MVGCEAGGGPKTCGEVVSKRCVNGERALSRRRDTHWEDKGYAASDWLGAIEHSLRAQKEILLVVGRLP